VIPVVRSYKRVSRSGYQSGLCCKEKADLVKWVEKRIRGLVMRDLHPFKWRHFEAEIILLCIRWYLRYALSYRDLEEMMLERGLAVDHTTIYRFSAALWFPLLPDSYDP
jgi:hypothetical protein